MPNAWWRAIGELGRMSEWEVGTDIGGTFTDIVAIHGSTGERRMAKVLSRPGAPVDAMLEAIEAVGLRTTELRRFVHGTTRVTNAIVEGRLPPIALIATAGFEDVLEFGRYRRAELYRLEVPPKPPPLVPRERCFGLRERLDHTGAVVEALTESEIDRLLAWLDGSGIQSVAISLLHSYANPVHERRVADALRGVVPHVCVSHEINPEAREFERTSSTAFNAAAMPVAVDYLLELERRLPLGPGLQVFHSAGAMVPLAAARARPITMAMSGPAAGVSACVQLSREMGFSRALTFDMGGTTTDVCLVVDGAAEMTDTRMLAGRPLRLPMLAVHSIGAGGGSVVRLGPGGLTVGPDSAGAEPGPACYGRGGTLPTVTDANAILGYLDPATRLGDRIVLDVSLAERALAPIAEALGMGIIETALGVITVANATMARALRRVTVERGIDGRDCALIAFGGGGPMHGAGLADIYGITQVVIPGASSAFSALGCLAADFSVLQQRTVRLPLTAFDAAAGERALAELAEEVLRPLLDNGVAREGIALEHTALMRYAAQSDATAVPFTAPIDPTVLQAAFHLRHRELYGYATEEPVVIESLRVQSRKPSSLRTGVEASGTSHAPGNRLCSFPGAKEVPTVILDRTGLSDTVAGPAIIADAWSTVVVPPAWQVRPLAGGTLILERESLPQAGGGDEGHPQAKPTP